MGKKKQREGEDGSKGLSNPTSDGDVFNSIFGDSQDHNASISIFSDSNPFRRKSTESGSVLTPVENPNSDTHDLAKLKKRMRRKDKRSGLDSSSSDDDKVETKKSKKEKTQILKLESDSEPNVGSELKTMMKKKRKRDELETVYEVKKYGAVPEPKMDGGAARVGEKRKKLDDPAEMLVPKEGFDDENKLLRTVFVGNLPLKVKKKGLLKEFSQFGEVESVRIRSIPILDSKTPRTGAIRKKQINDAVDSVHAYIVFKTEQCARASLTHNMAVVEGNHIRVDRACPPRKKLKGDQAPIYDNKRTVFVGNLPFDVKDEEIYQLFSGISSLESSIEAIRVVRDPHSSAGKGIAYVLFKTRDAAHMVVKKRNLKIRDRDLRLSHAKSDSTPSKRSNMSSPASSSNHPAKKFRADSGTPSDSKYKSPLAYQGVRASKSGVQKKSSYPKNIDSGKSNFKSQKGEKTKDRKGKRPSVAARKAKVLNNDGGGPPTQVGKKRKLESRSPGSSQPNKKMKKFK